MIVIIVINDIITHIIIIIIIIIGTINFLLIYNLIKSMPPKS